MRRRPKKIAIRPVEGYRRPIPDSRAMHAFLTDTRKRGYLSVYLVRSYDLDTPEVKEALAKEERCKIVKLDGPELLSAAYAWMQARGGLKIMTTLYGGLEKLG